MAACIFFAVDGSGSWHVHGSTKEVPGCPGCRGSDESCPTVRCTVLFPFLAFVHPRVFPCVANGPGREIRRSVASVRQGSTLSWAPHVLLRSEDAPLTLSRPLLTSQAPCTCSEQYGHGSFLVPQIGAGHRSLWQLASSLRLTEVGLGIWQHQRSPSDVGSRAINSLCSGFISLLSSR